MRIIAGKHKGRKIELVKEAASLVRPTSDFVRESIFNILMHSKHSHNGDSFVGKRVLDMFCGSGAFGLEALSRGASHVTFIDKSREALISAKAKALKMHEEDTTEIMLTDASKLGRAARPFALIVLDPPYFGKLMEPALTRIVEGGWADEGSLIVIEHDEKEAPSLPPGLRKLDERRYGRAVIELMRLSETGA